MYKAVVFAEAPISVAELHDDMEAAGIEIVEEIDEITTLVQLVVRCAPDIVIALARSPSAQLFEAAQMVNALVPRPFILFTSDADPEKITLASDSGIQSYVVDGYARHRLPSLIQVARARFRHEQVLKDEFTGLSRKFEERKLVDRAKGILMRSRGVTEDDAFELLRGLAMQGRQRLGIAAQSVIDLSQAGEAVNRAGQLRMLSQRVVKCYAQILAEHDSDNAIFSLKDGILRIEANLGILAKAISTKGYRVMVERVAEAWRIMSSIAAVHPIKTKLIELDDAADEMLQQAERLTAFLEASGLVSSLPVLNIAGRQRMLSQRIVKHCFFLAVKPNYDDIRKLNELIDASQTAHAYLRSAPLSSMEIRRMLDAAELEWVALMGLLASIGQNADLASILASGERLLQVSEELTDQYEKTLQLLMGSSVGMMAAAASK